LHPNQSFTGFQVQHKSILFIKFVRFIFEDSGLVKAKEHSLNSSHREK